MIPYPATTIDEVITNLDLIIKEAKEISSPMGYFAVLYRRVTIAVRDSIRKSEFEDNRRMERLDVCFANRYFDAWIAWTENRQPSQSWYIPFETNARRMPVVLQHLLLGIHAHINFDLGLAAVETAGGTDFHRLKNDFGRINSLLASLLDEVKTNMGNINRMLYMSYPYINRFDEFLVNFSMIIARDGAWNFALELNAATSDEQREAIIDERDLRIAELARRMADPGIRLTYLLAVVRAGEMRPVQKNLEVLERASVSLTVGERSL